MKKLFVCALAVGLFTACSQDETISQQSPMQISFEGAFVNNASRVATAADPSTTTATLKAFDVWAYMDQAEGLFLGQNNGEDVTGEKGNFTYVNTAYWNAGHTYYFHALAPMNSKNVTVTAPTTGDALGLSNVAFTNIAGTEDLLYSTYTRTIASGKEALKNEANTGTVNLTFSHLLSKVKFSFKNTYTNENIKFEVKNIEMTAPKTGNIDLNNADWKTNSKWSVGKEDVSLAFGTTGDIEVGETQESTDERLTIPADETQEYTITFDVLLYNGTVLVNEKDENGDAIPYKHNITLTDYAFEIGKAYDLYAELNADNIIDPDDDPYYEDENSYSIVFDVNEVEEWAQATDEAVDDWLVETNEELVLISDATTDETVILKGNNILNGNGNTLSMLEGTENYYDGKGHLIFMQTTGNATIKNLTIDGNNASYDGYGIRGIFLTGEGTVTLDNVKIKNVTYTINDDASAKTLKVTNSEFEGWTSYNATATFENVAFSKGTYGRLRPYSNTTLTNCTFTEEFILDLSYLASDEKVTLTQCKVGDKVITADNYSTLFKIDGYDANKIEFK